MALFCEAIRLFHITNNKYGATVHPYLAIFIRVHAKVTALCHLDYCPDMR